MNHVQFKRLFKPTQPSMETTVQTIIIIQENTCLTSGSKYI